MLRIATTMLVGRVDYEATESQFAVCHGMNTGIQDAHNLAWKLTFVLRGVAPETWLDMYESELRRVAEDVIAMTRSATEQTEIFMHLSQSARTKLCEHLFVPESEKQRARHRAEELDLDDRSSPLCIDTDGDFDAGPHAGSQVLDAAPLVVDGARCSVFDLLRGTQHRLFLFTGVHEDKSSEEITRVAGAIVNKHQHWIDVFFVLLSVREAMLDGSGLPGGSTSWSSGVLLSLYIGVLFRGDGDPVSQSWRNA